MTLRDMVKVDRSPTVDPAASLARMRLAVLWLVAGCALAGTMAVFFYEPGVLEEGVEGEMEGQSVTMGMALLNAAMLAVPLVLAAAMLFLSARASAVANLVAGIPLGAFGLFAVLNHLLGGELHAHLVLAALAAAIAWLIVGLSVGQLRRLWHDRAPAAAIGADAGGHGA